MSPKFCLTLFAICFVIQASMADDTTKLLDETDEELDKVAGKGHQFVLRGKKNEVQVLIDSSVAFDIEYPIEQSVEDAENNVTVLTNRVAINESDFFVNGSVKETNIIVTVDFPKNPKANVSAAHFQMHFSQRIANGLVQWKESKLVIPISEEYGFDKKAKEYGESYTITYGKLSNLTEKSNQCWRCTGTLSRNATQIEVVPKGVLLKDIKSTLKMTNTSIEAFKAQNNTDFSPYRFHCLADQLNPVAGTGRWSVMNAENYRCLSISGQFSLKIKYTDVNGTEKGPVEIPIPADANVNLDQSRCGNASEIQTIQLDFLDNKWNLRLDFEKPKDKQFAVTKISFHGDVNEHFKDRWFKDAIVPSSLNGVNNESNADLSAKTGYSIKCFSEETVQLDNVTLSLKKSQLEAFVNTTKAELLPPQLCSSDIGTSDVVPIIVGACLAALVVVVLVAYLIGRARAKRQGYASV